MLMRALVMALLVAALPVPAGAREDAPAKSKRLVTVMTRNVYHGVNAELNAVAAGGPANLLNNVAAVFMGYHERDFPERAAALAAEIEATRPELVGLQEAILVRTQSPPDGPTTPASAVALDYVQILLDALAARGLAYERVGTSNGWDPELPSALGFDVRQTGREVILARADLKKADLKLSNVQTGTFATNCVIPSTIGPITILRGWVSVDVKIRGKKFRFLSTHLDGDCLSVTSAIQEAQAAELLAGPLATELPVVLVGDFNSPTDGTGPTYNTLIGSGFVDPWILAGPGPGFTCCQAPDLLNADSSLGRRIDLVLYRGGFGVVAVDIVGEDPDDQTLSGLWPSDHAGVVATLQLPGGHRGRDDDRDDDD